MVGRESPSGPQEGLCWPPLSPPLAFISLSPKTPRQQWQLQATVLPCVGGWAQDEGRGLSGAEPEPPPPVWPSPQNARLSTARPASATTSAPSVRRACTCTKAAATLPVPRALRLQTAPWSAAARVSRKVRAREGAGRVGGCRLQRRAWAGLRAEKAHDDHPLSFSGDFYALWTLRMPLARG